MTDVPRPTRPDPGIVGDPFWGSPKPWWRWFVPVAVALLLAIVVALALALAVVAG